MPRTDDYRNAIALAAETLRKIPVSELLPKTGFAPDGNNGIKVPFLNRIYRVNVPDFIFSEPSGDREIPLQEQVLILRYMAAPIIPDPTGEWIAFREIPGASFYFSAFVKRAVDPIKTTFGSDVPLFRKGAILLDGKGVGPGDAAFEFRPLPKVPVRIVLWEGDAEFPAEANVLFDETAGKVLSPEDAAWLAGMLAYRLIALTRA
jgi:hypothetical protein